MCVCVCLSGETADSETRCVCVWCVCEDEVSKAQ